MTITPTTLYWLTRLDGFNNLFMAIFVFGTLALIILSIANLASSCDTYNDDAPIVAKETKKWIKILMFPWLLALLGILFVPTSKEMAMIYVVPHITESQVIKQDIPEVYDLGVKALKDWLKKETKENNNDF